MDSNPVETNLSTCKKIQSAGNLGVFARESRTRNSVEDFFSNDMVRSTFPRRARGTFAVGAVSQ